MDLIMHIGMSKTASTSVQKYILEGKDEYLGRCFSRNLSTMTNSDIDYLRNAALWSKLRDKRTTREKTKKWIEKALLYSRTMNLSHRLILSDETLTRWHVSMGNYPKYPVGPQGLSRTERERPSPIAYFLDNFFMPEWQKIGNLKVVLTLRNQSSWLASQYIQGSSLRKNASKEDFEKQVEALINKKDPFIDWNAMVSEVEDVLGKTNVVVLLYEDCASENYWASLYSAFGLEKNSAIINNLVNQKYSENTKRSAEDKWGIPSNAIISHKVCELWPKNIPGKGRLNKILTCTSDVIYGSLFERSRGNELVLNDELKEKIRAYCRESNFSLGVRLGRDITNLGY